MAADGFPAQMNYFEVTETQRPLRVVRGEIKEWEVNHENTFTLRYSTLKQCPIYKEQYSQSGLGYYMLQNMKC